MLVFMPVLVLVLVFAEVHRVLDSGGLVLVDEAVVVPLGHGGSFEVHREVAHAVVIR